MKTLGLVLVLSIGVLVMMLVLIPVQVDVEVRADESSIVSGKVRVGHITVRNDGWFTKQVRLPELTACVGDQEVPLDGWLVAGDTTVRGVGQLESVMLRPGEEGTIYLIASDAFYDETIKLYYRESHFSCLTPGTAVAQ